MFFLFDEHVFDCDINLKINSLDPLKFNDKQFLMLQSNILSKILLFFFFFKLAWATRHLVLKAYLSFLVSRFKDYNLII